MTENNSLKDIMKFRRDKINQMKKQVQRPFKNLKFAFINHLFSQRFCMIGCIIGWIVLLKHPNLVTHYI